jgi:NADH-quinone oxidoreductase subunit E
VLIFSIIIVTALAAFAGYYVGARRPPPVPARENLPAPRPESTPMYAAATSAHAKVSGDDELAVERERISEEEARIIRSLERETAMLRAQRDSAPSAAEAGSLATDASALATLSAELGAARAETERYRKLVVDIENNAPPPILQGAAEPDDLKLIVGVGPVLERMLRNLGIHNFRQIARWSAHDIAEFDARLPEFPGRIVRDQWVTQARALHESKYGESALGKGS